METKETYSLKPTSSSSADVWADTVTDSPLGSSKSSNSTSSTNSMGFTGSMNSTGSTDSTGFTDSTDSTGFTSSTNSMNSTGSTDSTGFTDKSTSNSSSSTKVRFSYPEHRPLSPVRIHPSSLVGPEVVLGEGVSVGPFCILDGKVEIGKNTLLHSHVSIGSSQGRVRIGANNVFFAGAVIGGSPQDKSYQKTNTSLVIGDHNIFREYVTVHLATEKEDHITRIGSHNYIMAYSHIAHNCLLEDHITMANGVQLAGHVRLGYGVVIGGMSGITQFVRVGRFSFLCAKAEVRKDVLPFCCMGFGNGGRLELKSSNKLGLQKANFPPEDIMNLHKSIRILKFGSSTVKEGVERIQKECERTPSVLHLLEFIRHCKSSFVQ